MSADVIVDNYLWGSLLGLGILGFVGSVFFLAVGCIGVSAKPV